MASQRWGWQPATLTPDLTKFPPSWAQGSLVFSPLNLGTGPSHGPPAFPVLTLLIKYPHASTACAPHPHSPPPQRHTMTHAHAHILIPGRRRPSRRRPPGMSRSSGGPSSGPWPCSSASPSPSFLISPRAVSHPAPCTSVSEEVAQSPGSCKCGQGLLRVPSRKAFLTHKSTQLTGTPSSNLTHPGLQAPQCPCLLPD